MYATALVDSPFAFRVEDDAVSVKDIKFGPFGSPLLAWVRGGNEKAGEELSMVAGTIGGKFKADPNPDPPPAVGRPRKK